MDHAPVLEDTLSPDLISLDNRVLRCKIEIAADQINRSLFDFAKNSPYIFAQNADRK